MNTKYFIFVIILLILFTSNIAVLAQEPGGVRCTAGQEPDGAGGCRIQNPAPGQLVNIRDFGVLLATIIQILLAVAGAIAVIFLIIGGFRYVTAQGNEEGMEKAKKTITGAIIGIVIIVLAFAIVAIVNNLLVNPPQ